MHRKQWPSDPGYLRAIEWLCNIAYKYEPSVLSMNEVWMEPCSDLKNATKWECYKTLWYNVLHFGYTIIHVIFLKVDLKSRHISPIYHHGVVWCYGDETPVCSRWSYISFTVTQQIFWVICTEISEMKIRYWELQCNWISVWMINTMLFTCHPNLKIITIFAGSFGNLLVFFENESSTPTMLRLVIIIKYISMSLLIKI